jgi:hypothetical protein
MATSDTTEVTFLEADLRVRLDDQGRVRSISGRARIPPPHERISFEDPVRADVGFFRGEFLNSERELGILLRDDTDYFVFDVQVAFQMNIATGDTGEDATRPVVVKAPLGGRALMVVDYTDPMYYTFGAQDLLGAAGHGWSLRQRLPYRPVLPVDTVGAFDGGSIRTGTIPIFKVLSLEGEIVDNEYTEIHMTREDPFASGLRKGYRAGVNGDVAMDLFVKDVAGIELPLVGTSGGIWGEGGTDGVFRGHLFLRGKTTNDFSWWPTFIPARPIAELDGDAFVTHTGDFSVGLEGRYGWRFADGDQTMAGGFRFDPDALTLRGTISGPELDFPSTGEVTEDATRLDVAPPETLLDAVATEVNDRVLPRIEEARSAWEELQQATEDYEFELSLRGLRSALPTIVDRAKSELDDGIDAAIRSQDGEIWEGALRDHLRRADDPYHRELDALKAAALEIEDDDRTRAEIERALRAVASRKIFSTTFTYRDPVFGTVLYRRTISFRILSDSQAARLVEAADNVRFIEETSDRMIALRDVYEQVEDRELFEQVRDDLREGVLQMRGIEELGLVFPRDGEPGRAGLTVTIDGRRYEGGALGSLTLASLMERLPGIMIEALKVN